MYILSEILEVICPLKKQINNLQAVIDTLSYDSRKIHDGEHSIFFALNAQRDGHRYIAEAYNKKVRTFIVTDMSFDTTAFGDANFIWVQDSLQAMQQVAAFHRSRIPYPVVGITGSNGKTIVKEWLTQMMMKDKLVYQSPKSFNSQLGVALSIWQLPLQADIAFIEAGISTVGEMARLQQLIKPDLGIFTSLGTAHREGFASKEEKLVEKWKLFEEVATVVAPEASLPASYQALSSVHLWGEAEEALLKLTKTVNLEAHTLLQLEYRGQHFELNVPFKDKASIENILTCTLFMLDQGYSVSTIQERVLQLKPLEMRLQLKKGKNNSSIIDDTYSNDVASLEIALDFLSQQQQYDKRKLVLSDFEGERWTTKVKDKVEKLLSAVHVDEMIFIGERLQALQLPENIHVTHYQDSEAFQANLTKHTFSNAVVLLKGARKYHLEQVSRLLTEKSHETVLGINLSALEHNLKAYRQHLAPEVRLMVMVKAFSYGSGSFEVANILQFNNVDYLTVAFADEGAELRRAGIKLPIMVLSPHESVFEDLVQYRLEPEVYSADFLRSFIQFLAYKNITDYPVHIKLDTGMHRLGFMPNEVDELITILKGQQQVRVQSSFSHLVGAGDPEFLAFTKQQIALFQTVVAKIQQQIGYTFIRHICNTSGIIHHPEAHMEMVRLGIGLYGFDMTSDNLGLEEVSQLRTTITQIKHIPKTDTIGYDRKGKLNRDSVIATVKIGYADGYNRRFGNGVGQMIINNQFVHTVGNICMDMCMLDVTDIEAKVGDEVIVFPNLAKAAKDIGTIPYELLTAVSSRVKRIYYYE